MDTILAYPPGDAAMSCVKTRGGVEWIAEIIHPRRRKERLTVVLAAYLDASGKHRSDSVVAVAGFIASASLWVSFESRWQKFLDEFGLQRFHAAQFWSRKGRPYSTWDSTKHNAAAAHICAIFRDLNPFGVGAAVDVNAFNEWRSKLDILVDPNPYYFCLSRCMRPLIRIITTVPNDEGVAIYVDQDTELQSLGYEIARWHESRLRQEPAANINPERSVSTTYGSSLDFLPLQAADILAHASFQCLRDFLATGQRGPEPAFLACMKSAQVPVAVNNYFEQEHFNIEMRKSVRASKALEG